jgi:hypothetical protein
MKIPHAYTCEFCEEPVEDGECYHMVCGSKILRFYSSGHRREYQQKVFQVMVSTTPPQPQEPSFIRI